MRPDGITAMMDWEVASHKKPGSSLRSRASRPLDGFDLSDSRVDSSVSGSQVMLSSRLRELRYAPSDAELRSIRTTASDFNLSGPEMSSSVQMVDATALKDVYRVGVSFEGIIFCKFFSTASNGRMWKTSKVLVDAGCQLPALIVESEAERHGWVAPRLDHYARAGTSTLKLYGCDGRIVEPVGQMKLEIADTYGQYGSTNPIELMAYVVSSQATLAFDCVLGMPFIRKAQEARIKELEEQLSGAGRTSIGAS